MTLKPQVEVVPASPVHVGPIANRMRAADIEECRAMGRTPRQALRLGLVTSTEVWTAKVDGRPEAMFGLVVTSALGGKGVPWMLGTDEIYRHPRLMIRHGQRVLRRWLDSCPTMSNYVSVDNSRAIRLLRRWGCSIGWKVIMHGDVGFVSFTMER